MRTLLVMAMLTVACSGQKAAPVSTSKPAIDSPEALDFRMICEEATRAAASTGSSDDKRTRFADAVTRKLRTDGARKTLDSAGALSDSAKHAVLRQGAAELGIADWQCPAIATIYGPQSATLP